MASVLDMNLSSPVDPISLIESSNQPYATVAYGFQYDNTTPLNTNGVLFQGDSGAIYNLWSNGGSAGELYTYGANGVPSFDVQGTLSVNAVPEPAGLGDDADGLRRPGRRPLRGARQQTSRRRGLIVHHFDTVPGRRLEQPATPFDLQASSEPVIEARWDISIQFPAGSLTMEMRAVVPSVTGAVASRPPWARTWACSASTLNTWKVR